LARHRAPGWLSALVVALAFSGSPAVSALTVCSIGVGGSGRQLDTGTGGTGIDTGHGGTGVQAEIGTGGTGIDTGHGGTGVQAEIGTGGTGIDTGQAGTGQRADVGVGGTGIDTGTGGTGIDTGTGGTGIVGVITGFGSICVNGIEVEFDARTPVSDNGAPGSPDNLKIGQVVEVVAAGKGERVMARQIHVRDAVLGPVTRVDPRTNRVEVMNQPVRWERGTVPGQRGAAPLRITDVRPGQFLRVSGFRTDSGEVIASRIDPAPAGDVRLTGRVTDTLGSRARIQGVSVEVPSGQRIENQAEVAVTGQWQRGTIRATRVDRNGAANFAGRTEFVSVQGSIGRPAADGSFSIGAMRVKFSGSTRVDGGSRNALRAGEIVQVEGRLKKDNSIEAERVYVGDRLPRPDDRGHGRNSGKGSDSSGSSSSGSGDDDDDRSGGSDSSGRREDDDDSGSKGSGSRDDDRDHSDRAEKAEKTERDRTEKAEKAERDRAEKLEKIERDRVEKLDKIERDRVERLEKIERDAAKDREKIERDRD
jgi:hypothetical protein